MSESLTEIQRELTTLIENTSFDSKNGDIDLVQSSIHGPSNFVVVTYWWGRGNSNANTARPCISFWETFLQKFLNIYLTILKSMDDDQTTIKIIKNDINRYNVDLTEYLNSHRIQFKEKLTELSVFSDTCNKMASDYINSIYEYLELWDNKTDRFSDAKELLRKYRKHGKNEPKNTNTFKFTASAFELMTTSDQHTEIGIISEFLKTTLLHFLDEEENYKHIVGLYVIKKVKDFFQEIYFQHKQNSKGTSKSKGTVDADTKTAIDKLNNDKKEIISRIKLSYKAKNFDSGKKNLYDLWNDKLRFVEALKFEEMIDLWIDSCKKSGCNYLAVEYPRFALPGGYQLAINAKPEFIKQALKLCKKKNVLYIDGDMFIRKKPEIFELKDIDFMARGWSIDPRSSYKSDETISYDPYTFETSGGTMFFSQSYEAKRLIKLWIQESHKSYQQGKADDRILSLVFNTYKLLTNMKVIQLPIEYLWLSLDYHDRMSEKYDWDYGFMKDSIFIEHPECLTTEDTAGGSGASNDRTPKFYNFIEENVDPVSEMVHEFIMYDDVGMSESLRQYYEYMNSAHYFDDGNPILVEKRLVIPKTAEQEAEERKSPEEQDETKLYDVTNNEQPLYVVPYKKFFGTGVYTNDDGRDEEGETTNDVAIKNLGLNCSSEISDKFEGCFGKKGEKLQDKLSIIDRIRQQLFPCFYAPAAVIQQQPDIECNKLHILDSSSEVPIRVIIDNLLQGASVLCCKGGSSTGEINGISEHNKSFLGSEIEKRFDRHNSMEFLFVPIFHEGHKYNDIFRPMVDMHQPILFRPCLFLIKFIAMFRNLKDFSDYISNGSYEFMSRVRVSFLRKKRSHKQTSKAATKGKTIEEDFGMSAEETLGGKHKNIEHILTGHKYDSILDDYEQHLTTFYTELTEEEYTHLLESQPDITSKIHTKTTISKDKSDATTVETSKESTGSINSSTTGLDMKAKGSEIVLGMKKDKSNNSDTVKSGETGRSSISNKSNSNQTTFGGHKERHTRKKRRSTHYRRSRRYSLFRR